MRSKRVRLTQEEIEERNQNIVQDYKSGMKTLDIVIKYRLSHPRIYQILNEQEVMAHAE